ncbi:MAG: hypothetical protein EKK41_26270 [Hyphomicrobiales bacterium]|nr:MAG: hypothetical protein EKK41_26270 [Hyphomicrobiales bacterium]
MKPDELQKLRTVVTENLRVQRDGDAIDYVNVGVALTDACAKQNHVIFARRGCGKTLLLHHSSKNARDGVRIVYLNCEDFKRHSFPNVLIEILSALFRELDANLHGWFGKKARSKQIIGDILKKLADLRRLADNQDEDVKKRVGTEAKRGGELGTKGLETSIKVEASQNKKEEIETTFRIHKEKLRDLDLWLPELKTRIREFFSLSQNVNSIFLQIDDLYHLRRADQAFVVDYIHRLCKDLPLYFKIATLRHASTLYADRDGQPIGAQERHDYQPINIDYTFSDFKKTRLQNWQILVEFGKRVGINEHQLSSLFMGEGFERLVMAGGGVPRDVLSLFLEVLSNVNVADGNRIGKDEVRILSRSNFERHIEELKQDSQDDEQDDLLRGIYAIREFCLEKKTNVFAVQERTMQQSDELRSLINRLMDYRIIHSCASALTHKSQPGTFQVFAIDIGCYAHLRKHHNRFNEVDVSSAEAKERMRSCPILEKSQFDSSFAAAPEEPERLLLAEG